MFLVVLGHLLEITTDKRELYKLIYIFHMPLFIILAGFTFKNYIKNKDYKKIFCKTIIPLIIFQIFYTALEGTWTFKRMVLLPHTPLWFLLSLFFWCLITIFIQKNNIKKQFIYTFILTILIGFIAKNTYYFSYYRTINFLPFFLIGFHFDFKYFDNILKYKKIIIFITILLTSTLIFNLMNFEIRLMFGSRNYSNIYQNNYIGAFKRALLMFYSIIYSLFFLVSIPNKKNFFSKYGANTFFIFAFHIMFIDFLKRFLKKIPINLDNIFLELTLTILIITACILLNKIKDFIWKKIRSNSNFLPFRSLFIQKK